MKPRLTAMAITLALSLLVAAATVASSLINVTITSMDCMDYGKSVVDVSVKGEATFKYDWYLSGDAKHKEWASLYHDDVKIGYWETYWGTYTYQSTYIEIMDRSSDASNIIYTTHSSWYNAKGRIERVGDPNLFDLDVDGAGDTISSD